MPASNQLFIAGSAVNTIKPAKTAKVNLGQRTTQPTEATSGRKLPNQYNDEQQEADGEEVAGNADDEQDEQDAGQVFHLSPSALPDNPRKAAIVLAARQKNHRPLPDLMLESADALIPRNWNRPEAVAVTVETTKAKGPTSCTKRTVLRLRNEGEPAVERAPNVMELAIKWDVRSPPASAGTRKKMEALSAARRPVEKTLDWLYEQVPKGRPVEKEQRKQSSGNETRNQVVKQEPQYNDSQYNSRAGSIRRGSTGSYGRGAPCAQEKPGEQARESDPESGYNSPRSADGEHNKTSLADLDEPVKAVYRSTASSATPPKNHFLVSTTGYKTQGATDMLPEYPLQRRSPVQERHYSKPMPIESKKNQHQVVSSSCPVNEYPPQRAESVTSDNYRGQTTASKMNSSQMHQHYEEDDRSQSQHQYDGDSGVGDLHEHTEEEYDEEEQCLHRGRGQAAHSRARPCVACESPSNSKTRTNAPRAKLKNHGKAPFKLAMKAGVPATKSASELEKVTQRRQSYRAPKPAPLSSHARHIRGTLAPPLAAGSGIEPIVDYPDFKRLESTYRLSYGAHQNPQRRRQKTLTAMLNEKNCRQWRS